MPTLQCWYRFYMTFYILFKTFFIVYSIAEEQSASINPAAFQYTLHFIFSALQEQYDDGLIPIEENVEIANMQMNSNGMMNRLLSTEICVDTISKSKDEQFNLVKMPSDSFEILINPIPSTSASVLLTVSKLALNISSPYSINNNTEYTSLEDNERDNIEGGLPYLGVTIEYPYSKRLFTTLAWCLLAHDTHTRVGALRVLIILSGRQSTLATQMSTICCPLVGYTVTKTNQRTKITTSVTLSEILRSLLVKALSSLSSIGRVGIDRSNSTTEIELGLMLSLAQTLASQDYTTAHLLAESLPPLSLLTLAHHHFQANWDGLTNSLPVKTSTDSHSIHHVSHQQQQRPLVSTPKSNPNHHIPQLLISLSCVLYTRTETSPHSSFNSFSQKLITLCDQISAIVFVVWKEILAVTKSETSTGSLQVYYAYVA